MLTLSQLLLTGVNILSTSLYAVSTSLKSVRWKQKWQGGDCHLLSFSMVFLRRDRFLLRPSQERLRWTAVLLHYCADTHGHLWIRVLLLNRTDRWVKRFQLLMRNILYVLPLCITADSEGFVALREHGNGHLKSYEHDICSSQWCHKVKKENLGACPQYFIKMAPLIFLLKWVFFFTCFLCLSCFTRVFGLELL